MFESINKLKALNSHPHYAPMLRYLRDAQRSRASTDLYQLSKRMESEGINASALFLLCEQLMRLDLGVFVQGRKRRPPRFIWKYAARSVGAAAFTGKAEDLISIGAMQNLRRRPDSDARSKRLFRVPFPLTRTEASQYIEQILKLVDA